MLEQPVRKKKKIMFSLNPIIIHARVDNKTKTQHKGIWKAKKIKCDTRYMKQISLL